MTNGLAVYNQTRDLLKSEDVIKRFQEVLGSEAKAQAFLASVLGSVYTNDSLKECEPNSIMFAALKAATLDLPVDPNIGQAYIIPYNSKNGKVAQFQIGYRGIIQLALRTKEYLAINATEIYQGEKIVQDRLTGSIKLNGVRTGDEIIAYCSYFKMKSGYEHYLIMTVDQLREHAKKYSKSYKYDDTLWHTNFDAMAKKTVLKMNLGKYGELRIDVREVLAADDAADMVDGEVRDLTKMEPEPEPQPQPQAEEEPKKRGRKPKEPEPQTPPEPEAPPEAVVEPPLAHPDTEPEYRPPQKQADDFGVQMSTRLVAASYFTSEVMAKVALRYYTGVMSWEAVEPWAIRTVAWMDNGENISQAAMKADKGLTP